MKKDKIKEVEIEVELLSITPGPAGYGNCERLIEEAGRIAYQSFDKMTAESAKSFITNTLIKRGHESVLEHAYMTVRITGISRACSHQLVRHRLFAFTQQSQRFVDESKFCYIIPDSIKNHQELKDLFLEELDRIRILYSLLKDQKIPNEDARFILPNATETQITVSGNMRQWRHFLKLRGDPHAQWEIRKMAIEVYKIMLEQCDSIVSDFILRKTNANQNILVKKVM